MIKNLFLSLSLLTCVADGAISQSDSLIFLEQQIGRLGKRDMVVFDMDDVLIMPTDAILHDYELLQQLNIRYASHLPPHKHRHLYSCLWKSMKTVLVEPQIPSLIETLQKRGVKVIVLTAVEVGSIGLIEDSVAFRIQELRDKGIDLSAAFPDAGSLSLHELDHGSGSPAFRRGVILSHHFPKGQVLATFLKRVGWTPRRLLFIDDKLYNVQSVEQELSQMKIDELQSWHYTANEKHKKEVIPAIAHLQIRTLVEQGIWLSDDEASRLAFKRRKKLKN
jgi:Protein of unknown function (DUF2608)